MTASAWTLIMFVLVANGSQSAVRVGFVDQLACVSAGKSMQQGFLSSPETADAKLVWSCVMESTVASIPAAPPPVVPEIIQQPPPPTPERPRRSAPRRAEPAVVVPARPRENEEQRTRKALPEWLGGDKR